MFDFYLFQVLNDIAAPLFYLITVLYETTLIFCTHIKRLIGFIATQINFVVDFFPFSESPGVVLIIRWPFFQELLVSKDFCLCWRESVSSPNVC